MEYKTEIALPLGKCRRRLERFDPGGRATGERNYTELTIDDANEGQLRFQLVRKPDTPINFRIVLAAAEADLEALPNGATQLRATIHLPYANMAAWWALYLAVAVGFGWLDGQWMVSFIMFMIVATSDYVTRRSAMSDLHDTVRKLFREK